MVYIIGNDLLKDLNEGKVINLEIGGLGFSLASEKWANRMNEIGNVLNLKEKNVVQCPACKKFVSYSDSDILKTYVQIAPNTRGIRYKEYVICPYCGEDIEFKGEKE